MKVAVKGNKKSAKTMSDECYVHNTLIKNGMTYLPKLFRDGLFDSCPYLMSEYAEFSIEEYMNLPERKLSFQEICYQMVEAVE